MPCQSKRYIRIALTNDDMVAFISAKKKAEADSKISMSDSMFALSVIRHATQEQD